MTVLTTTYLVYLVVSILLTVWVARTLHKNGRIFLVEALGKEDLADSVNHLLLVGFYLVNIGYVTLALRSRFGGPAPADLQGAVEFLSFKIGLVLVVLGAMHFTNLYLFGRLRKRAELDNMYRKARPASGVPS